MKRSAKQRRKAKQPKIVYRYRDIPAHIPGGEILHELGLIKDLLKVMHDSVNLAMCHIRDQVTVRPALMKGNNEQS
jgi:hypothetical protein